MSIEPNEQNQSTIVYKIECKCKFVMIQVKNNTEHTRNTTRLKLTDLFSQILKSNQSNRNEQINKIVKKKNLFQFCKYTR